MRLWQGSWAQNDDESDVPIFLSLLFLAALFRFSVFLFITNRSARL